MVTRARPPRLAAATLLASLLLPGIAAAQPPPPAPGPSAPSAAPPAPDAPPVEPVAPPANAPPIVPEAEAAPRPPAATEAAPRLHHAPISTAPPGEPIEISATIERPELVRYAGVVYRNTAGVLRAAPFQRSVMGGYTAVIPASAVKAPGLSYAIELERVDGVRVAVFASRSAMHPISVVEDRMDARERAAFERLGGRRSVLTASAEYVQFGTTTGSRPLCPAGRPDCPSSEQQVPQVDDQYWRVEAGYTYRPLRTVAEFSLRGGVVRGKSLVDISELDEKKYEVGLNYGAPTVRFRFADSWHLELEFLTSITEIGFSVGLGNALMIGDPYGSKLTLGFETIGLDESTYFGSRFYSRLDIAAADRVTVSPMVEVTDMPHAESFGVRLLGEAGVALGGGFGLGVRAGYQARKSTSGGPSFGGHVSLAF
ncbi:MAG: hypothetical protein IT372_00620 [Polyangiaceae bacterium]|nr:hypothetical protein [Polyangiaceae bacterium]